MGLELPDFALAALPSTRRQPHATHASWRWCADGCGVCESDGSLVEDESSTFVLFLVRPAFSMFCFFPHHSFFIHTYVHCIHGNTHTTQGAVNSYCGRVCWTDRTSGGRERKKTLLMFIPLTQCSTPRPAVDLNRLTHITPQDGDESTDRSGGHPHRTQREAAVATLDRAAACACRHSTRLSSVRCHERSSTHRAGAPHVHLVRADATHRAPWSRHSVGQRCASYLVPPARPCSAQHLGRPTGTACSRHRARESLSELSDMCT